jgi:hypothetical protein
MNQIGCSTGPVARILNISPKCALSFGTERYMAQAFCLYLKSFLFGVPWQLTVKDEQGSGSGQFETSYPFCLEVS